MVLLRFSRVELVRINWRGHQLRFSRLMPHACAPCRQPQAWVAAVRRNWRRVQNVSGGTYDNSFYGWRIRPADTNGANITRFAFLLAPPLIPALEEYRRVFRLPRLTRNKISTCVYPERSRRAGMAYQPFLNSPCRRGETRQDFAGLLSLFLFKLRVRRIRQYECQFELCPLLW